jgi:hypothetical protein
VNFLPYSRVDLQTSDPADLVTGRLAKMVAVGWFTFWRPKEPFRGSVSGNHFKVVRVLGTFMGLPFHNSWQPVIIGDLVPMPGGTVVRVRMRLNAFVGVFMAVWFGVPLAIAAKLLWGGLRYGFGPYTQGGQHIAGAGVGLAGVTVMLLLGYGLMSVAFWPEVKRARHALRDGLGCVEPAAAEQVDD